MKNPDQVFILEYFDRQLDEFSVFLKRIPGVYKMKDIHQIRVRIKRLKAIFRLLEFIHPVEFRAKDRFRLFKPVFKNAGLIRESQINLSLLANYSGTDKLYKSYSKYVANLRSEWNANLDSAVSAFNHNHLIQIKEEVHKYFSKSTETELVGLLTDFIYAECERIKDMIDESGRIEYAHEGRIILKNIKPVLALLWPRVDSIFDETHYKSLNTSEKLIGNWHDRVVLLDSLTRFYRGRDQNKKKISEEYNSLKKRIQKYEKDAMEEIHRSLEETLLLLKA